MAQSQKKARKGGKKNRKLGRNKKKCERYTLEGREEKNALRRLRKHLGMQPNDRSARAALNRIVGKGGGASAPLPLLLAA